MNLARSAKLGAAILVPLLVASSGAVSTTVAQTQAHALTAFDFDNGNIAEAYVIPTVVRTVLQSISGGDASLILYLTSTTVTAWFDAIAPYSARTVGVFSHIPRRPAEEGAHNRHRNIALMHASYHTLSATQPRYIPIWRKMLTDVGLNPDEQSTDLTTAVGIGNFAGKAVAVGRAHDGFNRDGDKDGRTYKREPYTDYTGYAPVNSAFELVDPSRWQPKVVTNGNGIFQIQKFVTPQWRLTKPFTYDEPQRFQAPPPKDSHWQENAAGYKRQADEVLAVSANLTDHQKMVAELFNHKFQSLGRARNFVTRSRGMTLEEDVQYNLMVQIAAHDGGIAIWSEKAKYDAVRPFSAIRFVYGHTPVRAWGGPGKGTVNDITGNEWESYLPVADHPEYPSGSGCFCAAHAQASRRFLGTDEFGWSIPRPKGSSVIEPGITPATDLTLAFPTFTDFEQACAMSRVWGGVHFKAAVEEGAKLCKPIGDLAYEFVERHIRGIAR